MEYKEFTGKDWKLVVHYGSGEVEISLGNVLEIDKAAEVNFEKVFTGKTAKSLRSNSLRPGIELMNKLEQLWEEELKKNEEYLYFEGDERRLRVYSKLLSRRGWKIEKDSYITKFWK